jgi:hypothetical protein
MDKLEAIGVGGSDSCLFRGIFRHLPRRNEETVKNICVVSVPTEI